MSYRMEQSAQTLLVEFHPRLQWPAWLLYAGVFSIIGAAVAWTLPSPPLGVVVLGLFFLVPFLVYLTYRESLVVSDRTLRIEHRTLGFIDWAQEYSIEDVRWVRFQEEEFSETEAEVMDHLGRALGGGIAITDGRMYRIILGCGRRRLAFNVGTRRRFAGPGLLPAEAEEIASSVRDWVHSHQKTVDPNWT